ncbi:hypothetical protein KTH_36030 [Thermosporothrix hazakensis]|jgi:signal transduction histidine kinase|nr:hypothetical protein KTH_36030 [Thermosporothrix hazakensis]
MPARVLSWFSLHTFAPVWVPRYLRGPLACYFVPVVLLAGLALLLLLLQTLPGAFFPSLPFTLLVVFVALNWGAGPGLITTVLGALLLFVMLTPSTNTLPIEPRGVMGSFLFVLIGACVSILASTKESERRTAEMLRDSLLSERALLNTVIDAIPDALMIFDAEKKLVLLNRAARTMFPSLQIEAKRYSDDLIQPYHIVSPESQKLTADELAIGRAFKGETVVEQPVRWIDVDGNERDMAFSAAPFYVYNPHRKLEGVVGLAHDITELKRSEKEIRRTQQRMEEFLGIAGHELRTPLTTVKASVQLAQRVLRKRGEKPGSGQTNPLDLLDRAERQVAVLNRLVGDLLDVSRIQANKLKVVLEEHDLLPIVQQKVEEQQQGTRRREIRLRLPEGVETVPVRIDPTRIGQVLTNYLSNACKFSGAEVPVTVEVQLEQDQVIVLVHDQGPGLTPEEQEQIWERFYQAERVQDGSSLGLGLGLHIAGKIIEYHNGRVGVDSVPGKGSTFWFSLPLYQKWRTK